MAERLKATVLKTVGRKTRGFESHSLRSRKGCGRGGRVAEGGTLLMCCRPKAYRGFESPPLRHLPAVGDRLDDGLEKSG